MKPVTPAYAGEVLLLRWSETAKGRTVTFQLDPHVGDNHPFKFMKAGENGSRFQLAAVLVDDQDQPAEPPTKATISGGEKSGDVRKSETVSDRSRHQKAEGGFDPHRPQLKRRSNIAAVLCQENQAFKNWLVDTYWTGKEDIGDYDGLLKRALGITSKTELDVEGPAAERWDRMLASFQYRHTVRA